MEDVFQQSRYRINVVLLSLIGQWPYQKKEERRFFLGITLFFCCTLFIAQVRKAYIERNNPPIIIEGIAAILFNCICGIKLLNNIFNTKKMHQMLKCIETDWEHIGGEERKILTKFADEGHMLNVIYAVWIYATMILCLVVPVAPRIIVACGWANISASVEFPIPIDYYIDDERNYVYIQIHLFISIFLLCTIIVASDIMFIMFVQHACGMFSAVSHTLENLLDDENLDIDLYPQTTADQGFWVVTDCIKKQKSAISMIENFIMCSIVYSNSPNYMYTTLTFDAQRLLE